MSPTMADEAGARADEPLLIEEAHGSGSPDRSASTPHALPWESVCVAVIYGLASVITTLANKALLSSWGFDLIFSLIFLQNLLTVTVGCSLKLLLRGSDGAVARAFEFSLLNGDIAMRILPACVVCGLNLWCGMSALSLSSVPVYQTLKRMTPLPAMALDALLRQKRFSSAVMCSVGVVCLGAFLTGCGDLDLNAYGYAFAISSCVLQALYLVLAAKAADTLPLLSSLCVNHYNALCSLPFLALGVVFEREALYAFPHWHEFGFWRMLTLDLVLGASLSLLLFMCTLQNSALTTTLVGNAKAILTTALGALIFGRGGLQLLGWVGIGVNTAGGILYSVVKYRERKPSPG